MDDVIFVSVAFGDRYVEQQETLLNSIKIFYPEAKTLFFTDVLPIGSKPFFDSLYGFKPHAIMEARRMGYRKIIWLDPAMILMGVVDDLLKYEVMAVKDDHKLGQFISDAYLMKYQFTREGMMSTPWHLVGGSLYYFDFNSQRACDIFNMWMLDEIEGLFGTQDQQASERLQGHRSDETCLAMAMYMKGVHPVSAPDVRYCTAENPMFIKKHFK